MATKGSCNTQKKVSTNWSPIVNCLRLFKNPWLIIPLNNSYMYLQSENKWHYVKKRLADQICAFPKCDHKFKNKGDLTRHAQIHTGVSFKCPHCNYSNPDQRNYKSHWLTHTNTEKYLCPKCNKIFKFNAQKRQHLVDKKCEKDNKKNETHSDEYWVKR